MEKDKLISQDEEKVAQEHVQKVTDKHTHLVNELVAAKEKELMTL
jgi:ribosome recycling factor